MKSQHLLLFISAILLSSMFSSCKKYLDEKPDKKLVVPKTVADLQALLDNNTVMNQSGAAFDESSATDYYIPEFNYPYLENEFAYMGDAYTWRKSVLLNFPKNDWYNLYNVVGIANTVLGFADGIERTTQNGADLDNIRGQALFFRAHSFLKAAFIHAKAYDDASADADPGIPLRTTTDFTVKSERASVRETYKKITADLDSAIKLLSAVPGNVMRPSKPAAYALLARTWLSMRNYEKALEYADKSLEAHGELLDYNSFPPGSFAPFSAFNTEVLFYSSAAFSPYYNPTPFFGNVDDALYSSYADNDLRKSLFFFDFGTLGMTFTGSYNAEYGFNFLFNGVTTSEMYLTRAECNARLGNKDAALQDLNALLSNRMDVTSYVPVVAATAQEALSIILVERRKELLFRGLRWMDIKRLNKEGANITLTRDFNGHFTLPPNDNRYALPIPDDVIKMSGMPQNAR